MKRKIFSQISLLLAIFTVVMSLSACGTTKTADTYTDINEDSSLIKNLEATSTETVGTPPAYNQEEAPTPRTSQS